MSFPTDIDHFALVLDNYRAYYCEIEILDYSFLPRETFKRDIKLF